jgi:hypothetical protein
MGGNTGNIRSRRPSSCNGYKTLGSILASDSGSGAGSIRRIYGFYAKTNQTSDFYQLVFNIQKGQFKDRTQWFLKTVFP